MKQQMTSSGMPAFKNHGFSRVPNVTKPRSTFDRSFPAKSTIPAGFWIPIVLEEILPGDTFKVMGQIFARLLSPLSVPIMDNLYIDWIAIYAPNRILWEHFINQMGETPTGPSESIDYLTPGIEPFSGGVALGSIGDYFGIPIGACNSGDAEPSFINALPFRMYNLFIAQWVVAQNVVDSPTILNGDGPDPVGDYPLAQRMKRPDYLTSCQPATQKGNPVQIPLGQFAPVIGNNADYEFGVSPFNGGPLNGNPNLNDGSVYGNYDFFSNVNLTPVGVLAPGQNALNYGSPDSGTPIGFGTPNGPPSGYFTGVPFADTGLYVDLANATSATINEFRLSAVTQQFLELDERGGTRFPEFLHNHFGVQSSDARLQRVEFIGAGTIPIMAHVVPQTAPVISGSTPQANLAAFTSAAGRCAFTHSFEEHGWLMVLVEIRADITYQNGLQKKWSRQTRFDYYDPLFANIGEQPVLNQEIYLQNTAADAEPFGYQEYAAEYRFGWGQVTGLMRAGVTGSIDVYNLALNFTSLPGLNSTFLNDTPPIARVSAVTDYDYFILDSFWNVKSTRVMPMFSIPGLTRI